MCVQVPWSLEHHATSVAKGGRVCPQFIPDVPDEVAVGGIGHVPVGPPASAQCDVVGLTRVGSQLNVCDYISVLTQDMSATWSYGVSILEEGGCTQNLCCSEYLEVLHADHCNHFQHSQVTGKSRQSLR